MKNNSGVIEGSVTSFVVTKIFIFTTTLLYCAMSAHYESLNPGNWAVQDSFFFTSFFTIFGLPTVLYYVFSNKDISLESQINTVFDLSAYGQSKYLDVIFSHYTNVATVGLFFMGFIYIARPLVEKIHNGIFGGVLALVFISILFLYSLFIIRLALYLKEKKARVYFLSMGAIVAFDMQILRLFIDSVP